MSDQHPGGWQPPPQQQPPGWGSPQPPKQRQPWPPKVKRNVLVLLLAVALLPVALLGALWVWGQPPPDSEHTVWMSLYSDVGPDLRGGGQGANGVVVVTVGRRVADLGPFGARVAALVAPTDHRLPGRVVGAGGVVSFDQVDVHLAEPLVPRRLDTQAVQRELAAAGFRWLVVHLSVEERSQVLPSSAAAAGKCWGDNGLSCEWRLATAGPPLRFEVRPLSPAQGRP